MHYNQKQKTKTKRLELVLILGFIFATFSVATTLRNNQSANMSAYAKAHNCTWQINGSAYGDNRDQVCK